MSTGVLRKIASEVTSTERQYVATQAVGQIAQANPLRYSISFGLPAPPGVVISSDPNTDGTKGFTLENQSLTRLTVKDYGSYAQGDFYAFTPVLPFTLTVIETVFNKDE